MRFSSIKLLTAVLLFVALLGAGCQKEPHPLDSADSTVPTAATPSASAPAVYSNLNGVELKGALVDHPIGVVIENYAPIRPLQRGLKEAAVVYETLAEGGITRFLALYNSSEELDAIGPVRSARPYFVDWAQEYRAAFVHVGGSPAALKQLESADVLNLDEFLGTSAIYRLDTELPPHNAYTSIEGIRQAIINANYDNALIEPHFPFKDDDPGESPSISVISINFWNEPYEVQWRYIPHSNSYERYNGGQKHDDITAKNIIIQFTDQEVIDDELRRRITTSGVGRALIFQDGHSIDGRWENKDGITRFYDLNGKPIALNRGPIWIEVVENSTTVNYF